MKLAFALAAAVAVASVQNPAVKPDVLYVPTPQPVVDAMLQAAEVKSSDIVYDLGSGDGRIPITAATKYGAHGVGVEIDPQLVQVATDAAKAAGVADRVRFVNENLFTANISDATVVTLYLLQSINERLRPKLIRELKPGTRVVSHVFNMGPEWPPQKTLEIGASRVFVWTIADRDR
jgi:ubiquinone/menaquinone biosynthesis C-methylase UbiE